MLNIHDLELLKNNLWYSQLPETFQQFIIDHGIYQYYERDQAIFRSGDHFNGIYAVLKGNVRLGHIDIDGNEAIAAIVEPIMWFGEISLVDAQPRSHDAICIQKSTILYLSAQDIQQFLKNNAQYWYYIAQLTSQKLRFAFMELISIHTQNMTQRLSQRLLFIINGYGNHMNNEKYLIHISQEQLAQMLMCSRQTINHELQQLEKLGIIDVSFKKITVLNAVELHRLAHH